MTTLARLNVFINADLSGLEKGFKRVGKQLSGIGKQMSEQVSAPIAAIGAAIGLAIVKTAQFADELGVQSVKTGLSVEALQQLGYASEQLGFSFDAIQSATAGLTKKMASVATGTGPVADAFRRLGVSAKDADGNTRGMGELFPEIIKKLGGVNNATDRNVLAMQLFGKSASELTPLIAAGGGELERLMNRATDLGLVMGGDSVESFAAFNDTIDEAKAQFKAIGISIAVAFLPVAQQAAAFMQSKVVPAFQAVAHWVGSFSSETLESVAMIGGLLASVGPLALALSGLMKLFAFIISPVGLAAAAIGTLGVVAITVARNWDDVKLRGVTVWAAIKNAVLGAVDTMLGGLERLTGWIPGLGAKVKELRANFNAFADESLAKSGRKMYELEQGFLAVKPAAKQVTAAIKPLADTVLPDVASKTDKVGDALKAFSASLRDNLALSNLLGTAYGDGAANMSAYEEVVKSLVTAGVQLDQVIGPQGETLRELANRFLDMKAGVDVATESVDKIKEAWAEASAMTLSARTPLETYTATLAKLKEQLDAGRISLETYNRLVKDAGDEYFQAINKLTDFQHTIVSVAESGVDAMASFATGSRNAISSFVSQALKDLVRLGARMLALKALMALFPGAGSATGIVGGLFDAFGGKRAVGGPVASNRTYLVGERGPELFTPRNAGEIVPNAALGGSSSPSIDFSSFPAATNPLAAARDGEWLRFLSASMKASKANGNPILAGAT